MADGASGRKHHVFRAIAAAQKTFQVGCGEALHALGRTENRAADGLAWKGCIVEQVVANVVGAVAGRGDLLQDHLALAFELRTAEC